MDSTLNKYILSNKKSSLTLDLSHGGKILELFLSKNDSLYKIINPPENYYSKDTFCSSGSFLMFPWVNRLENNKVQLKDNQIYEFQPDFLDGNNLPLHGIFASKSRIIEKIGENFIVLICEEYNPKFPKFKEKFILEEDSLSVETEFYWEDGKRDNFFSFGYHPYITIDNSLLDDCFIQTDLDCFVKVSEKLLPIKKDEIEFENKSKLFANDEKLKKTHLDNCFSKLNYKEKGFFFKICNSEKKIGVEIKVNNDYDLKYNFCQIYTKPDRRNIAIEPQTSPINSFFIENKSSAHLCVLEKNERKKACFKVSVVDIN